MAVVVLCAVSGVLSAGLTDERQKHLTSVLEKAKDGKGSFVGLEEAFHFVLGFKSLEKDISPDDKTSACSFATAGLDALSFENSDIETTFYGLRLLASLKCVDDSEKINKVEKIEALVSRVLKSSSSSANELYFASKAFVALKELNNKKVSAKDLVSSVRRLESLADSSGIVLDGSDRSYSATGKALSVIGTAVKYNKLSGDTLETVEIFVENTAVLFEDQSVFFDKSDSRTAIAATSFMVNGALTLQSEKLAAPIEISLKRLTDAAEFLVENIDRISKTEDAFSIISTLRVLSKARPVAPILLSLSSDVLSMSVKGQDNSLRVLITDIWSRPFEPTKVLLSNAADAQNSARVLISNQELSKASSSSSDGEYALNFLGYKPEPGFYQLDFTVQLTSGSKLHLVQVSKIVKVTNSVVVPSISVSLLDENLDSKSAKTFTATAGKTFDTVLSSNYYYTLSVAFLVKSASSSAQSTKSLSVQQAFVRIYNDDLGLESIVPVYNSDKGFTGQVDFKTVGKALLFTNGLYKFQLIVGDAFIDNSFVWDFGSIQLTFPPHLHTQQVDFLSSHSIKASAIKPTISHVFRQAEKRPPTQVSFIATIVSLALPWLVLFVFIIRARPSLSLFGAFLPAVVFLASIAAIFGLYFVFFWFLNMFDTLKVLGLLCVVCFLSGFFTFRARAASRKAKKD